MQLDEITLTIRNLKTGDAVIFNREQLKDKRFVFASFNGCYTFSITLDPSTIDDNQKHHVKISVDDKEYSFEAVVETEDQHRFYFFETITIH